MKIIILSLLFTLTTQGAIAKVYKTCTKEVQVEALCAGEGDNHPEDPIFDPAFIYFSPKSYAMLKKTGLEDHSIKDELEVCYGLDGYFIYDLFGNNRLAEADLGYSRVKVEFIIPCEG